MSRKFHNLDFLLSAGISADHAWALRRIAMTLHRWHEGECGDSNDWMSTCIVRGEYRNGKFVYTDGFPYQEVHYHTDTKPIWFAIPDRERGALKRLAVIMATYPTLQSYVQSDPRGCALYILRPGDVPDGESADAYYSRGIPVH